MANPLIIKKVHLTEKATDLSNLNKYVFDVVSDAPASEIKKAIEKIYQVHVVKINMINIKKKNTRFRRLTSVSGGRKRKAVITLRSGEKLDIVPQ